MNLKIVKYHEDELIISPKTVSENINRVCSGRSIKWEVTGLVHKNETIMLCLDQVSYCRNDYFFAELKADNVEGIEQDVQSHWQSGIYLMEIVQISPEESLGFYRREK